MMVTITKRRSGASLPLFITYLIVVSVSQITKTKPTVIAHTTAAITNTPTIPTIKESSLSTHSSSSSSCRQKSSSSPVYYKLTKEQKKCYHKNGYIIIPNLLQGQDLKNAIKAADEVYNRKSFWERIISTFTNFKISYNSVRFQTWRMNRCMEHIAFDSIIPSICAQLMELDDTDDTTSASTSTTTTPVTNPMDDRCSTPIRLLKDAFLAFAPGNKGCGWHVDDKIFWPCQDTTNLKQKDSGINVWITLSPLSAPEGGGMAVSRGSHRASWREKARGVIKGSDFLTCEMEHLSPKYHKILEKNMVLEDMNPGDAIIHNRYTFHRVVQFKDDNEEEDRTKLRISLRYMPANAIFQTDYSKVDRVIVEKDLKAGDPISKGGEYFPQVWPYSLVEERQSSVKNDASLFTFKLFKMLMLGSFHPKTN